MEQWEKLSGVIPGMDDDDEHDISGLLTNQSIGAIGPISPEPDPEQQEETKEQKEEKEEEESDDETYDEEDRPIDPKLLVNVREEQKQRQQIVDAVSIDLGKSSNKNPSQLSPTMSLPEATVPQFLSRSTSLRNVKTYHQTHQQQPDTLLLGVNIPTAIFSPPGERLHPSNPIGSWGGQSPINFSRNSGLQPINENEEDDPTTTTTAATNEETEINKPMLSINTNTSSLNSMNGANSANYETNGSPFFFRT